MITKKEWDELLKELALFHDRASIMMLTAVKKERSKK
jgi:hypothetical protein